ncbi:DUF3987 domain-containing protein [Klebsiella oxytoca]|uniref:YfjI family protein n=1 Tax=Klebsiella oxytoca TaxID=571 RepID=UPI002235ABC2|nr:YfjI family protein [Klebsiella oxytoca]ELM5686331.1 DUF3987 domain-containing protein [Klebsiella oxytoca]MCW4549826.1 YfjI family protein [Klebsiella oxytoca]MCW4564166.1 YfjI family protein [Klebsiella oxytoca]
MYNPSHYPVDVFPDVLRDAIIALHEDTQFPVEMIGSTLLAATSLALQPLVEVISPYSTDKAEPCSLFLLTLADSGEGKGPIYEKIMAPFTAFMAEMQREYKEQLDIYKKDHATWSVISKGLNRSLMKASRDGEDCEAEASLFREHLDNEPVCPKPFEMLNNDNTPVGLIEQLDRYPYAGCFSSEAMTFFSGYLKDNLALLNQLWSDEDYSYNRKGRSILLSGCRLSILLMTQPSEFEHYVQRQGARDILNGFLARFLITGTISTRAQRKTNLNQERSEIALNKVFVFFNDFLEKQKAMYYDKSITPKVLRLSEEAKEVFKSRKEQHNVLTAKNQRWEHITKFISKAENQAIRIAALFNYYSESDISAVAVNDAFTLTEWHLNQAAHYFYESSESFQLKQDVYDLFIQIKKRFERQGGNIKFTDLQTGQFCICSRHPWQPFLRYEVTQYAPGRLRGNKKTEPAFNELINLGLIMTISYPPSSEIYVALSGYDVNGNILPLNSPSTLFRIHQVRNNSVRPSDNYDLSRLSWQ